MINLMIGNGDTELKLISFDRASNKLALIILGVLVLFFMLFISIPIIAVFLRLSPNQALSQLQNPQIINAIVLTLLTSVVATAASFFFAIPTAYLLATKEFRGKAVLDTIIDIPLVLPPAVAGIALLLAFAPRGLSRSIAEWSGLNFTRQHHSRRVGSNIRGFSLHFAVRKNSLRKRQP